jgi:hypothetical protein
MRCLRCERAWLTPEPYELPRDRDQDGVAVVTLQLDNVERVKSLFDTRLSYVLIPVVQCYDPDHPNLRQAHVNTCLDQFKRVLTAARPQVVFLFECEPYTDFILLNAAYAYETFVVTSLNFDIAIERAAQVLREQQYG